MVELHFLGTTENILCKSLYSCFSIDCLKLAASIEEKGYTRYYLVGSQSIQGVVFVSWSVAVGHKRYLHICVELKLGCCII